MSVSFRYNPFYGVQLTHDASTMKTTPKGATHHSVKSGTYYKLCREGVMFFHGTMWMTSSTNTWPLERQLDWIVDKLEEL